MQWKKNKWTWLKIDTCSGHKVERVVRIRRRWPVAVVTEDNLSALSTFQQHISPSFTMAVINCRRRRRHRRNGRRRRRWLLTWICFPICLNLSLRSNTQLTIELVRSQQSQANEVTMMTRKTKKHLAAVGNSSIHVGFGMRAAAAAPPTSSASYMRRRRCLRKKLWPLLLHSRELCLSSYIRPSKMSAERKLAHSCQSQAFLADWSK